MGNKYRKLFIEFLKHENIIQVDGIYYNVFSNAEGQKSLGYRIHPRLYSKSVRWETKGMNVDTTLHKNYTTIDHTTKSYLNSYPDEYKLIYEHLKDFDVNWDVIPNDFKKKYSETIALFKDRKTYFGVAHGGRIYSALGNIKKVFRKYIYYKPEPDLKFSLIDVSNCTYWALSVHLTKYFDEFTNDRLENLSMFIELIEQNSDKCIPHFESYIKSGDYRTLFKEIADINKVSKENTPDVYEYYAKVFRMYQNDKISNDVLTFILMACNGIIYNVIAECFGVDRQVIKDEINPLVNKPSGQLFYDDSDLKAFLVSKFPKVYEVIERTSAQNSKNFGYTMNKYETKLIIQEYGGKLLKDETPFVTIHDGLLIPDNEGYEADIHMIEISQASIDLFGLPIPMKKEEFE